LRGLGNQRTNFAGAARKFPAAPLYAVTPGVRRSCWKRLVSFPLLPHVATRRPLFADPQSLSVDRPALSNVPMKLTSSRRPSGAPPVNEEVLLEQLTSPPFGSMTNVSFTVHGG